MDECPECASEDVEDIEKDEVGCNWFCHECGHHWN